VEETKRDGTVKAPVYLPGERVRARWMRLDTAQILKRFFFCERSLLVSMAAWLPSIGPLDIKTELPRFIWQNAQTADALRDRVFELRYPSQLMEEGEDAALIALCDAVRNAPSAAAFLSAAGEVLLPALRDAYRAYLELSDPIADGPTHRFLSLALAEKEEQVLAVRSWSESERARDAAALAWTQSLAGRLAALGGIGLEAAPQSAPPATDTASETRYQIPDVPARDAHFWQCRFYWPDIVDASFPYGEGISLQLRAAVSHLNEVWAVETGGIILSAFADELPWEWIANAARWTYDEARHCRMGYDRLVAWGFEPAEIPLGTYIYDSVAGQDPIYRLGMLFFFETKNIKNKPRRVDLFRAYGDSISEHDMGFDWADETIHAGYGKRWLMALLQARGRDPGSYTKVRDHCRALVEACIDTATSEEIASIKQVVHCLIAKAQDDGSGRGCPDREGDPKPGLATDTPAWSLWYEAKTRHHGDR
jgi:hypothetical protein